MLVYLRSQHVEGLRRANRIPAAERAVMKTASWVMSSAGRFAAAERASKLGRVFARGGRIRSLPPPVAGWTSTRDLPAPPAETFREWWSRTHGNASGTRDIGGAL
jgi:L-lactate dehydrogenase complex protein LldF